MERFEHSDACSSLASKGLFGRVYVAPVSFQTNEAHSNMAFQEALAMAEVLVRLSSSLERNVPTH
jgi:hypothetical protein